MSDNSIGGGRSQEVFKLILINFRVFMKLRPGAFFAILQINSE